MIRACRAGERNVGPIPLKLPVLLGRFCKPLEIEGDAFKEKWNSLLDAHESRSFTLDMNRIKNMQVLAGFISLGGAVKVVIGGDERNNYMCGATQFWMDAQNSREALLKVEVGAGGQNCRLMVRSKEKKLSDALMSNFLFMLTD